jgi:hypothetical protein
MVERASIKPIRCIIYLTDLTVYFNDERDDTSIEWLISFHFYRFLEVMVTCIAGRRRTNHIEMKSPA